MTSSAATPVLELSGASLAYGSRTLWADLNLSVQAGEFVAILGSNGSGKSSLLRAILDPGELTAGTVRIHGDLARGGRQIGYIPQRLTLDAPVQILARDLVRLGIDGHRWGAGIYGMRASRRHAMDTLQRVGAAELAHRPVQQLSGGELQRVRVAAAIAGEPTLLLADEPLAALDLAQAQRIVGVIDEYRRKSDAAVLFVTHDINAVLHAADRVLYFAGGAFRLGTPDQVLTSETLTELYSAPVDVFRAGGRIMVVAAVDPGADHEDAPGYPHSVHAVEPGYPDPHGRGHVYAVGDGQ